MKKYPYVPADLVKSVNSVLDKRHNVIEQDLRDRYQLDESEEINEAPVVGVIKGQLPGDQHLCATKIFSEEFGEGTPLYSMHADPDEHGLIEWYDVMFEHGIERVFTEDVQVLSERKHKKHKKMAESKEYADMGAALAGMGEIKAFNDANPTKPRRARTPTPLTDAENVAGYKKMQRGVLTKRGLSTDIVKEPMKSKQNTFGEAKERPFDIAKMSNPPTSGYQLALKGIEASDNPDKGRMRAALSKGVQDEHPKLLGALHKSQNTPKVLQILTGLAQDMAKKEELEDAAKQKKKDEAAMVARIKKAAKLKRTDESVDIVKSAIRRLKESEQGSLDFGTGDLNNPLRHGYEYRSGWKVIENDKDTENRFRLEKRAIDGETHVVELPNSVKTVKHLMQHLESDPEVFIHNSRSGTDTKRTASLFRTVAFDRS